MKYNQIFLFRRIKTYSIEIKNSGIFSFLLIRLRKISDHICYRTIRISRKNKFFVFNKNRYKYHLDYYNFSWRNERTVEVPIAWNIIQKYKNKQILEVGNVLSNYFKINHDVLDKYEKSKLTINEDVVTFTPKKKYDLIIAISTLEHVGWEEQPQRPKKILQAVKHLKSLMNKNGEMIISLPIGYYNPDLNVIIAKNKLHFKELYFLKRISKSNEWKQATWDQVKDSKYNSIYPNANAILFGKIKL